MTKTTVRLLAAGNKAPEPGLDGVQDLNVSCRGPDKNWRLAAAVVMPF